MFWENFFDRAGKTSFSVEKQKLTLGKVKGIPELSSGYQTFSNANKTRNYYAWTLRQRLKKTARNEINCLDNVSRKRYQLSVECFLLLHPGLLTKVTQSTRDLSRSLREFN